MAKKVKKTQKPEKQTKLTLLQLEQHYNLDAIIAIGYREKNQQLQSHD